MNILHVISVIVALVASLFCIFLLWLHSSRKRIWEERLLYENQRQDQRGLDIKLAELTQTNAELTGRLVTMTDIMQRGQADMSRLVSDRLDAMGLRVGQSLDQSTQSSHEYLTKLYERLTLIDHAQTRLTELSQDMTSLRDILNNKQTRGAFGQGRMEAIIRDGLPHQTYIFQATLSNNTRPDCLIRLPGDSRGLVVDAKFPLESFSGFSQAPDDLSRKQYMVKVRTDMTKHIKDIADRYFIPGETQDIALLFVPSESLYADLQEYFDDILQKAHRYRIIIVSPSLLMMALQILQTIVRDTQMRQQAHIIQAEVQKLLEDVGRLQQRIRKLDVHFRQVQEDVSQLSISGEKIVTRGQKIAHLELSESESETADTTPVIGSSFV